MRAEDVRVGMTVVVKKPTKEDFDVVGAPWYGNWLECQGNADGKALTVVRVGGRGPAYHREDASDAAPYIWLEGYPKDPNQAYSSAWFAADWLTPYEFKVGDRVRVRRPDPRDVQVAPTLHWMTSDEKHVGAEFIISTREDRKGETDPVFVLDGTGRVWSPKWLTLVAAAPAAPVAEPPKVAAPPWTPKVGEWVRIDGAGAMVGSELHDKHGRVGKVAEVEPITLGPKSVRAYGTHKVLSGQAVETATGCRFTNDSRNAVEFSIRPCGGDSLPSRLAEWLANRGAESRLRIRAAFDRGIDRGARFRRNVAAAASLSAFVVGCAFRGVGTVALMGLFWFLSMTAAAWALTMGIAVVVASHDLRNSEARRYDAACASGPAFVRVPVPVVAKPLPATVAPVRTEAKPCERVW